MQQIHKMLDCHLNISMTYFVLDEREDGGSYQIITEVVRRTDSVGGTFHFRDGRDVPLKSIIDIQLEA